MADSYAQLALAKNRTKESLQHAGPASGAVVLADLEDKVLDLAKLLKACQVNHAKKALDQEQAVEQLSAQVMQLEAYLQSQISVLVAPAAPESQAVRALSDRLMLLEGQLIEGLQENHHVHQHNAEVILRMEERITKLEERFAEESKQREYAAISDMVGGLVRSRLDAFENEVQARLLLATSTLEGGPGCQVQMHPLRQANTSTDSVPSQPPQEASCDQDGSLQHIPKAPEVASQPVLGGKENRNAGISKAPLPSALKAQDLARGLQNDDACHLKRLRKLRADLM